MGIAEDAIRYAVAQVGKPYVWGATGPNSYDCSGLLFAAYRSAGYMNITRTTYTQIAQGTPLDPRMPVDQRPPGVLIFPYAGHVYMALGGGQIVEAPHTGTNVHVTGDYTPKALAIRQLVPAGSVRGAVTSTAPVSVAGGVAGDALSAAGISASGISHGADVLLNWITYLALITVGGVLAVVGAYWLVERPATAVGKTLRRAVPL